VLITQLAYLRQDRLLRLKDLQPDKYKRFHIHFDSCRFCSFLRFFSFISLPFRSGSVFLRWAFSFVHCRSPRPLPPPRPVTLTNCWAYQFIYTFLSSVLFFCPCVTNEFAAKVRSKKIEKKSRPKPIYTWIYIGVPVCVCVCSCTQGRFITQRRPWIITHTPRDPKTTTIITQKGA